VGPIARRYADGMIGRRSHPRASVSARRTEAFTDGVFAIAATLLVLGLTDHPVGALDSDAALGTALAELAPTLATFVIAFLVLCRLWMTHVEQFEHIVRVDTLGMWLNTLRLLFVVLVPFAASVNYGGENLRLGQLVLPGVFLVSLFFSWLQWLWAARSGAVADLSAVETRAAGRAGLTAVVVGAGVVALSPWLGSWAFLLYIVDGPLSRALGGRHSSVDDPDGDVGGRG